MSATPLAPPSSAAALRNAATLLASPGGAVSMIAFVTGMPAPHGSATHRVGRRRAGRVAGSAGAMNVRRADGPGRSAARVLQRSVFPGRRRDLTVEVRTASRGDGGIQRPRPVGRHPASPHRIGGASWGLVPADPSGRDTLIRSTNRANLTFRGKWWTTRRRSRHGLSLRVAGPVCWGRKHSDLCEFAAPGQGHRAVRRLTTASKGEVKRMTVRILRRFSLARAVHRIDRKSTRLNSSHRT